MNYFVIDTFYIYSHQKDTLILIITRHPTNRIFKCVIVAKLKGTVRRFRGAKAVTQFSMYVAKISLAAKIQSNTLAKHYLRRVYLLQLKYRVYQFSRSKASDNAIFDVRR